MLKQFSMLFFVALLVVLSFLTWPHQNIFQQSWYGISFMQIYITLSLIIIIGLLISLVKHHKQIAICFMCVFFSWFLTWLSWKDALPPKTYIPLNDTSSRYRIEKNDYNYMLCHTPETGERLCGFIGSSIYPLDKYVDQEIIFSAQWRSDWGRPMCHMEPCPVAGRSSVIDILDIKLATPSSLIQ